MNIKKLRDVPIMWQPSESNGERMKKFKKVLEKKYNLKTDNYIDLHKWSVNHPVELWTEIWFFSGMIYSKVFEKVVDLSIPLEESPVWFQGAKLNLAENLLKHRDEKIALLVAGENKESEKVTYAQLYEESKLYAASFRKFGLKKGDVVVCQMTNRKEAIFAMIAVVSIGAIWTGISAPMGTKATLSRIKQLEPKIYLSNNCIRHQRKHVNMLPKVKEISEGVPSLKKVIIVSTDENVLIEDIGAIQNSCFLNEFLLLGREKDGFIPNMLFEQVSFTHPVYILFTSGTTGTPKAIIHGNGILLALYRDYALHLDCGEGSVWFSYAATGWAVWNVSTCLLFCGVTLVLFEEWPFYWSSLNIWQIIEKYKGTHILIAATVLDELRKANCVPQNEKCLESLKVMVATGCVVKPQNYDFIYKNVKKDVLFSSIYGCTEMVVHVFVPDTTLAVHRGEFPAVSLGVKVEILDDTGKPVFGEIGEVYVANPIPNLTLGLWNDQDNLKFRACFFSKYPEKFSLNDYGIQNPFTKGYFIFGRSDETLKKGVYRFASSEIYSVVDSFPEVMDSICVPQFSQTFDERSVLFLQMKEGYSFSEELANEIRKAVERELSFSNVPEVILETKDVPYNINGKKMEIVVNKIINKRPYNAESVFNSESLKCFQNIPELNGY